MGGGTSSKRSKRSGVRNSLRGQDLNPMLPNHARQFLAARHEGVAVFAQVSDGGADRAGSGSATLPGTGRENASGVRSVQGSVMQQGRVSVFSPMCGTPCSSSAKRIGLRGSGLGLGSRLTSVPFLVGLVLGSRPTGRRDERGLQRLKRPYSGMVPENSIP